MKRNTLYAAIFLLLLISCSEPDTVPKIIPEPSKPELPTFFVTVISENGLLLRSEPSKNSSKQRLIKFGEAVRARQQESSKAEVVDGIKGEWLIAEYFGETGFIFSGYARKISELSKSIKPIKPADLVGQWIGHRFDSYTKLPITKLDIQKGGKFIFTLFTGGDEGSFGTRTVSGTWKLVGKTVVLFNAESEDRIRYALLKDNLILAEDVPSPAHHSFVENYDYDYPSGLSK
ncbi:MAG: SH3 domain-containing protein [Turneriella sp.]